MKFTSPGGMFELSAELAKGLELVITDSGIGIKPAALERITTPFIQADSVDARDHQGTGLGLNLTKVLMEQHGGKLTLQSELGGGTTLRLWFPPEQLTAGSFHEPEQPPT